MRGHDEQQESMYSYISPEKRIPSHHPLRRLRAMMNAALKRMSPQLAELMAEHIALKKSLGEPDQCVGAARRAGPGGGLRPVLVGKD